MYILTEGPDYDQITQQIEFNYELREVYTFLLDKLVDWEEKQAKEQNKDEENKVLPPTRQERKSVTTKGTYLMYIYI